MLAMQTPLSVVKVEGSAMGLRRSILGLSKSLHETRAAPGTRGSQDAAGYTQPLKETFEPLSTYLVSQQDGKPI